MSPRSEEFMQQARDALQLANLALGSPVPWRAVSEAYYAMLYAARAALSEEDLYAKTHRGTWDLFRQTFVVAGGFDEGLLSSARKAQQDREDTDYNAKPLSPDDARSVVELGERFVSAVDAMLG